jgi:allantoinase
MTAPVDLVVRGANVLYDGAFGPHSVVVSAGRVSAVEALDAPVAAATVVDLADDEVLLPGLVDTHVHVNEPGRTAWEGFATATRAAAAGGVTTLLDMPLNSIPPTTDVPALEVKRAAAAGQCFVDVGFWGGAVPTSLGSLRSLHDAGVYGFKCFLLDSGVPEFAPLSAEQVEAAMREVAGFGGLLIAHCEDAALIAASAVPHTTRYAEFVASRPPEAEVTAIEAVIAAARRTGARAHIVHLSSARALPALRAARADGVAVTVETCPHYLTLASEDIADGQPQYKCCPPIRDAANSALLWEALAAGDIDFVVSDHSPSTPDLKLLDEGDLGAAWGGVSSLQLGLPLVWTSARDRGHDLATVVAWMSAGPARVVGVDGKGAIAPGYDADLVVFAPDETFTVRPEALYHRNPVSPYTGRELTGVVRATYLRGTLVGGASPHGRLIRPKDWSLPKGRP